MKEEERWDKDCDNFENKYLNCKLKDVERGSKEFKLSYSAL